MFTKFFMFSKEEGGRGVLVVVEPTCRVFTYFKNHKILYNLMVKGHKLLHIDVTTICNIYKILRPPLHGWYIDCRYGVKRKPQNNQSIKLNILPKNGVQPIRMVDPEVLINRIHCM